jgi:thiol-disulfide isomerase/thioredoxin
VLVCFSIKSKSLKALKSRQYISLIAFLILLSNYSFGQKFNHADSAFLTAMQYNKPILLNFSGSDWCPGCIRLHKNIISEAAFQQFAEANIVLLIADFPQKQKQSKEIIRQNEKLAEKYNPSGVFPKLILISPSKDNYVELFYKNQNIDEFLALLEKNIQKITE